MHAITRAMSALLALVLAGSTWATTVTVTRKSDTQIEVKICPSAGAGIKDFHFDKGSLANGAAGLTVTDDNALGWSINVKGGKVNVYGGSSVPAACATFTITLPAGHKFDQQSKGSIILTNDGNDDAETGVVNTISGQVPKVVLSAAFKEDFDLYKPESMLAGQGGWDLWYQGGADAVVSPKHSFSPPHGLALLPGSDLVHSFLITEGKWVFRAMTLLPEGSAPAIHGGYLIMMNRYGDPLLDNWSLQIAFNDLSLGGTDAFMVHSQFDNAITPIHIGKWVEFRAEIDLDLDLVTNFYNDVMLGEPHPWSDNGFGSGPGLKQIVNIDLWSPNGGLFVDAISLTPMKVACYADCEGDGDLDVFDFLCFQGRYAALDPYADCEGDGDWDIFDYLCFLDQFAAGCPG